MSYEDAKGTFKEYFFYQQKYEAQYGGEKTLVLMQVGSFYEAYSIDTMGANLARVSELLNIVKTRRDKSRDDISLDNPNMMGFPTVSINKFLNVLIADGYTVVIVDQVTPPPKPKREVTGVYSPGTHIANNNPDSNNLMCLFIEDEIQNNGSVLICIGMSVIDLSTGDSCVHEAHSLNGDEKYALDEAVRFISYYGVKEIIIYRKNNGKILLNKEQLLAYLELNTTCYHYFDKINKEYLKISYQTEFFHKVYKGIGMMTPIEYLDLEKMPFGTISLIALLNFAYKHSDKIINNIEKPKIYQDTRHLKLGNNAVQQLNVYESSAYDTQNIRYKCLFDVINKTSTAIGRRFLKDSLVFPLINSEEIELRYNSIEEFDMVLEENLDNISDIDRQGRRLSLGLLDPCDLSELLTSYEEVKKIINAIKGTKYLSQYIPKGDILTKLDNFIEECGKLFNLKELEKFNLVGDITRSFFNVGVNGEIDRLQREIESGINFLDGVCEALSKLLDGKIRKMTRKNKAGGKEVRPINIKRNDREGHYLTITASSYKVLVEELAGLEVVKISDLYNLPVSALKFKELPAGKIYKIYFDDLMNRSDDLQELRDQLNTLIKESYLGNLSEFYKKYGNMFKEISGFVGIIDFIKSAKKCAKQYNYFRPEIVQSTQSFIKCRGLRHPIIERIREEFEYVPHDICLGGGGIDGILLFGLNSAGKSSCMKSIGLGVIMAQCGMYVAATSFQYSPYHMLFARITGSDNIFKGLSSFALEMTELRAILKRVNGNTLVIGDEVCRGTEHVSGNSIVAASIINLSRSGCTFIFATHLHDIVELEKIKSLKNVGVYHLSVEYDKEADQLVFDRKMKPGAGEKVYGLTVARYIINDNEFMRLAQEIKNEIMGESGEILEGKRSKYNPGLYVDTCGLCGDDIRDMHDTHHINFQKDCQDGFVIDKPGVRMNSKANLIVLCKGCHLSIHNNKKKILGYKDTSKGKVVRTD